jgi:protein HIRA/HIR1
LKQRVTFTKEGKKRIAPLLVSASNQGEANLPRPTQLQQSSGRGGGSDEPAGKILDLSKPYDGLPKGGLGSLLLGNKRKFAELEADAAGGEEKRNEKRVHAMTQSGATAILNNTVDGVVPASASATGKDKDATKTEVPEVLRPAVVSPSLMVSQVRLAVPMVRSVILRPLDPRNTTDNEPQQVEGQQDPKDTDSIVFEARNASGPSRTGRAQDREPTRITVTKKSQILWQDFLPKAALLVTGNRNFCATGCEDGSLHLWTPAGRRLLNALVLEAQPVILDCRGWYLLAITAVGQLYVWNVKKMQCLHPPCSLAPVLDAASANMQSHLTPAPSLMFARLSSQGRTVVGMSNGDGYAYNPGLCCWQRLSEGWWAVGSQYWNTSDTTPNPSSLSTATNGIKSKKSSQPSFLDEIAPENISAGIIPLLERHTTSHTLLKGRAYFLQRLVKALLSAEGFEGFETSVSIAHLENRLAAAWMLGAREEFRVFLNMYAKRIGAEGIRGKVEELLTSLMGDTLFEADEEADDESKAQSGFDWTRDDGGDEICGWPREALLKDVVMVLGKHRDLQRLTVPYARFLGVVQGFGGGEGESMAVDG